MKNTSTQKSHLDKLNTERYENSLKTVKQVVRVISKCHISLDSAEKNDFNSPKVDTLIEKRIARAVNSLERVSEEMDWHCTHFCYDNAIVLDIDNVCAKLGAAIGYFDIDMLQVASYVDEALCSLGKIVATLVVWNDDVVDNIEDI